MKEESQHLKQKDYTQQNLDGSTFIECTFESCDFTGSSLRNAKFENCSFRNCNIGLVKLDGCVFQQAKFIDCKIVGAEFYKCNKTFFSANFKDCNLHYCNFSDLNMKNATISGKVKECHFTQTILTQAVFDDVDLAGTLFHKCDLSKADFTTAYNYSIDPLSNKIKKAKFSLPEAVNLLRMFDIIIE